jgi:RNA polymerase sigma-70 factor (ECF subfamily)
MNLRPSHSGEDAGYPMGSRRFATTHWSVVLRAGDSQSPHAADALEKLCRTYWYPLYAFVRASGQGAEEARDLTQEFFARILEKKWLNDADRQRGRFRTFLLAALKNFMANEWHRSQTLKRGGGMERIVWDELDAEARFALEPREVGTPDSLYDRRWAMTLIGNVQDRLRDEMVAAGDAEKFEALEPTLTGDRLEQGYTALATRLGVTETAVKSMVFRLRKRFRELLRHEIGETVTNGGDEEEELRELLRVLGGG